MIRRESKKILCGNVEIGGNAEISIQSMTNTDTRDVEKTAEQINLLSENGCQIVRCAVPDMESAQGIAKIKKQINIPLVADIHFDYRLAIESIKNGADKVRINPGNIGDPSRVKKIVTAAKEREIPIRIGVNAGSLEKEILKKHGSVTAEALVESALKNIEVLEAMHFYDIVVSLKCSNVQLNYDAHRLISGKTPYPLHIGITESGTKKSGQIKSAVGIGSLLLDGIGDTIRVSMTGNPVAEVNFAKEILKAIGLRQEGINFISCPTCARCSVDLEKITEAIENAIGDIDKNITVAVMGCEVNGPGEAKDADIGIACSGGQGVIFKKGKIIRKVHENDIVSEVLKEISSY